MNEITPNLVTTTTPGRVPAALSAPTRPDEAPQAPKPAHARLDKVELSDRARLLSKLAETPEIRSDIVDRVRAQIEDGSYPTADNLDIAADNLINDFDLLG